MSNTQIIKWMSIVSFKKLFRSKSEQITNLLELLILVPFFWFMGTAEVFGPGIFMKGVVLLMFVNSIMVANGLGISLIVKRKEGFFREVLSSPASNLSIFMGFFSQTIIMLFFRNFLILVLSFLLGLEANIAVMALVLLLSVVVSPLAMFFSIILSSIIENIRLLQITMTMVTLVQFFLSGILVPFRELSFVAANPFAYGADLLLAASGLGANFWIILDVLVLVVLTIVSYFIANWVFLRVEV